MFKIYDEPESLHEGACLRCMMNRNRNDFACLRNMTESPLQVVILPQIRAKQDLANCNFLIA